MALNDNALITIADVKDYYEIKSEASDINIQIEKLINRMSTLFESMIGPVKAATYTKYYDGEGRKLLFLDHLPIISITSINDDSEWEWESSTLIDSDDYMIHSSGQYIVLKVALSSGDQNIEVVYKAGFEAIPEDVKQVAIHEVIRWYKHRADFDVTAKSLPDGSVTYTKQGLLDTTKLVLDKYKQLVLG